MRHAYKNYEGVRHFVVIKGQPFYQSTGHNSGAPGCWIPCIFIKEHHLESYVFSAFPAALYDASKLKNVLSHFESQSNGWIAKLFSEMLKDDILKRERLYQINLAETSREKFIRDRIVLKQFLITSSQLNPGYFEE